MNKEGYSPTSKDPAKEIQLGEPWDITVSDETAKDLLAKALPMKKPIRTKKNSEQSATHKSESKQPVDVFDLIFGIKE